MDLTDLGMNDELASWCRENIPPECTVGRVTQEHRERYVVSDGATEFYAEITGNLRFTAASRTDFPAVGDWVSMTVYDSGQAFIHGILPRRSLLAMQLSDYEGDKLVEISCALNDFIRMI